ncbi:MAG: hypothetical protein ACRDTT_11510, partial [Pseudonocardiaceae bacterium]
MLARHVADAVRRALTDGPQDQRLEQINDLLTRVADQDDAVVASEAVAATPTAAVDAQNVSRFETPALTINAARRLLGVTHRAASV